MESGKVAELADILSQGHWTHDHPITWQTASEMGLPVHTKMPHEFYQLMNLFPQPVRQQPSVEFLPIPKHGGQGSGGENKG